MMTKKATRVFVFTALLVLGPVSFAQDSGSMSCEDWLHLDQRINGQELATCLQQAPWYGQYGCAVVYQSMTGMAYAMYGACVARR